MAVQINSTEVLGARLLREVAAEEGSLEDLLKDLCTLFKLRLSFTDRSGGIG